MPKWAPRSRRGGNMVDNRGYRTDHVIFNASYFMEEMLKKHKNIRFNGAGASHQMGQHKAP